MEFKSPPLRVFYLFYVLEETGEETYTFISAYTKEGAWVSADQLLKTAKARKTGIEEAIPA